MLQYDGDGAFTCYNKMAGLVHNVHTSACCFVLKPSQRGHAVRASSEAFILVPSLKYFLPDSIKQKQDGDRGTSATEGRCQQGLQFPSQLQVHMCIG